MTSSGSYQPDFLARCSSLSTSVPPMTPAVGCPSFQRLTPSISEPFITLGPPIGAPRPPTGRYPSASLMDVPGNAHYNALSLGYAYINNFLEGLKVSMIMHPSTQSFLFPSPPILASSASCRVVCTLFRATPLPIPQIRGTNGKEQQHWLRSIFKSCSR